MKFRGEYGEMKNCLKETSSRERKENKCDFLLPFFVTKEADAQE